MENKIEIIQREEWNALDNSKGEIQFFSTNPDTTILVIKTGRKFFYRLWFLISAPITWLIKGEIKIR